MILISTPYYPFSPPNTFISEFVELRPCEFFTQFFTKRARSAPSTFPATPARSTRSTLDDGQLVHQHRPREQLGRDDEQPARQPLRPVRLAPRGDADSRVVFSPLLLRHRAFREREHLPEPTTVGRRHVVRADVQHRGARAAKAQPPRLPAVLARGRPGRRSERAKRERLTRSSSFNRRIRSRAVRARGAQGGARAVEPFGFHHHHHRGVRAPKTRARTYTVLALYSSSRALRRSIWTSDGRRRWPRRCGAVGALPREGVARNRREQVLSAIKAVVRWACSSKGQQF